MGESVSAGKVIKYVSLQSSQPLSPPQPPRPPPQQQCPLWCRLAARVRRFSESARQDWAWSRGWRKGRPFNGEPTNSRRFVFSRRVGSWGRQRANLIRQALLKSGGIETCAVTPAAVRESNAHTQPPQARHHATHEPQPPVSLYESMTVRRGRFSGGPAVGVQLAGLRSSIGKPCEPN